MPRLTKDQAQETLRRIGFGAVFAGAPPDFFTLSSSDVEALLAEADLVKYRKPKTANGSRARYFYEYLARTARKEG
jgi:hypothetical protein